MTNERTIEMLNKSPHGQLYVNACRPSSQSISSISISSYDIFESPYDNRRNLKWFTSTLHQHHHLYVNTRVELLGFGKQPHRVNVIRTRPVFCESFQTVTCCRLSNFKWACNFALPCFRNKIFVSRNPHMAANDLS